MKMSIKKVLLIVLGCIGVGLGAVGTVVPGLPTFPFLMLAASCFAGSSEKLNRWLKNTKLYKDNFEDYMAGRGMTRKTKIRVVVTVTLLMGIGFIVMKSKNLIAGCIALGCIWLLHILYFCFKVKTVPVQKKQQTV